MTTYPTWSAGQRVTAAGLTAMEPLIAYKLANEQVTSSTTLQNDDELFLAVEAGGLYILDCWVEFTATSGVDIKVAWTFPAGSSMNYSALGTGITNYTDYDSSVVAGGTSRGARGNGATPQGISSRGHLQASSTAGTLQLQWAQNTSNAAATTVLAGSWIRLNRIA